MKVLEKKFELYFAIFKSYLCWLKKKYDHGENIQLIDIYLIYELNLRLEIYEIFLHYKKKI